MSGKDGTTPTLPVARPEVPRLSDLPLHGGLDAGLTHGLWNEIPALSWIMGLDDGQLHVRGTHPDSNVATTPAPVFGRLLRTVVREDGAQPFQLVEALPALDGTLHHYLVIGFPVTPLNGAPHPYMAGVAIDVTHQQQRVKELAHLALVDELTGLYNLRGFQLFAEHELKVAQRRRTRSAIVYVDVDDLKTINDAGGHGAGDASLIETAALLRGVFRECDVIGRLGGDEFAVFASDVYGGPESLAQRLRAEVPASRPGGLALSLGVAVCEPAAGVPLAALIAAADKAMYREKEKKGAAGARPVTAAGRPGTST